MIESTSQVMRDIADQRRELTRYFLMNPKVKGSLSRLRAVLGDDFVGVGWAKEAAICDLKIDEVLVGSIDFD